MGNQEMPEASGGRWNQAVLSILSFSMLFGLASLLLGLLFLDERGDYARVFYLTLLAPTLLLIVLRPSICVTTFRQSQARLVVSFLAYIAARLVVDETFWDAAALLRLPAYVLAVFIAVSFLALTQRDRLVATLRGAAVLSVFLALLNLWIFACGNQERLVGFGALSNPLLISHAYGFFVAIWLGYLMTGVDHARWWAVAPLGVLAILLYETGSRTPMLALLASVGWVLVLRPRRKVLLCGAALLVLVSILFALNPEAMLQRGLSYRTEIWAEVWRQSKGALIWGRGLDADLRVQLPDIPYPFSDPHNMTLSVLYRLGLVGVAFWGAMYVISLWAAWKCREDDTVVIFSVAVVYGLMAGMTEGGSFLARPKEHWLLIWIPLALLNAALLLRHKTSAL